MTAKEIENQFPDEWILIGEPRTNEHLELIEGTVLHHSKDRDQMYRRLPELKPNRYATLYTGRVPKPGTAIVL